MTDKTQTTKEIEYLIQTSYPNEWTKIIEKFAPARDGELVTILYGCWPNMKPMKLVSREIVDERI